MGIEGVRQAIRKRPFEPFALRLADGRSLPMTHPEFVAIGPRRIIVVSEDDSWSVIKPLLIVSLDYVANNGGRGNGK